MTLRGSKNEDAPSVKGGARELETYELPADEQDGLGPGWAVILPGRADDEIGLIFQHIECGAGQFRALLRTWRMGCGATIVEAKLDLMSSSARQALVRELAQRLDEPDALDWNLLLGCAVREVRFAMSRASAVVRLGEVDFSDLNDYLLEPLVVADGPSIIFGKGGSGKSYLALAVAIAVATGTPMLDWTIFDRQNVLYLDYEASAKRHAKRLSELCHGMGLDSSNPPVYHLVGREPIPAMEEELRERIAEFEIGLLVVDSVALACGGEPEKADAARAFFSAVARLGVMSLSIAHTTKLEENQYPFGSVFWHNTPRSSWNVRLRQAPGASFADMTLYHRKANDGTLRPPVGIGLSFAADAVRLETTEATRDSGAEVTLPEQILEELRARGPQSVRQLAHQLGAKENSVRLRLSRLGSVVTKGGRATDGTTLWALAEAGGGPEF